MERVLDGFQQLTETTESQHCRLGHGLRERHVEVHDGTDQVGDVGGIQQPLKYTHTILLNFV